MFMILWSNIDSFLFRSMDYLPTGYNQQPKIIPTLCFDSEKRKCILQYFVKLKEKSIIWPSIFL